MEKYTVRGCIRTRIDYESFDSCICINSGNYDSNATYRSGSYVIDGSTVYDWNRSGWGNITVKEGFMRSSNAVMAQLEQKNG